MRNKPSKADGCSICVFHYFVKGLPYGRVTRKDELGQRIFTFFRLVGGAHGTRPEVYSLATEKRNHSRHHHGALWHPHAHIVPDASDFFGNAQLRYRQSIVKKLNTQACRAFRTKSILQGFISVGQANHLHEIFVKSPANHLALRAVAEPYRSHEHHVRAVEDAEQGLRLVRFLTGGIARTAG